MSVSTRCAAGKLAQDGIFPPKSHELRLLESRLARFFQREYQRSIRDCSTVSGLGVRTDSGPMMEETAELMSRHYDETLELFTSFLDSRYRAYSMAYYGETPDLILASNVSLEDAQQAKFCLIAERAQIEGCERILNIGCGFGSLETFLLERYPGIEIVGVTPSKVQANYLRDRMRDRHGLLGSGRFKLIEGAFDQVTIESLGRKKFDLVVSVAVFEQVINMRAVLQRIAELLTANGRTFHHFITSQTVVPRLLEPKKTRIGLYFPGGRIWPHNELPRHTEHLDLANSWFVNGLNYWRTLDEWHNRYWANIQNLSSAVFGTADIAYWNEYFSLCKAMFAPMDGEFYGNSQYLFRMKN